MSCSFTDCLKGIFTEKILCFSYFLSALEIIHFSLSIAFIKSHVLIWCIFIIFQFKIFSNLTCGLQFSHGLLEVYDFIFNHLGIFIIFLLLISSLISLWSENYVLNYSSEVWSNKWAIWLNVPRVLYNMYFGLFLWCVLYIPMIVLSISFKSLLIFLLFAYQFPEELL